MADQSTPTPNLKKSDQVARVFFKSLARGGSTILAYLTRCFSSHGPLDLDRLSYITRNRKPTVSKHDDIPSSGADKINDSGSKLASSTSPADSLLLRPLSEPPIFCYTSHIEHVEEVLKDMREKPENFHHDVRIRMGQLDMVVENTLNITYEEWAEDMWHEASNANNNESREFYSGLLWALHEDKDEDSYQHNEWWMSRMGERSNEKRGGAKGASRVGSVRSDPSMVLSDAKLSEGSEDNISPDDEPTNIPDTTKTLVQPLNNQGKDDVPWASTASEFADWRQSLVLNSSSCFGLGAFRDPKTEEELKRREREGREGRVLGSKWMKN